MRFHPWPGTSVRWVQETSTALFPVPVLGLIQRYFPEGFRRPLWSNEEKIAELERYLEALRREAQAVEEELTELRKK